MSTRYFVAVELGSTNEEAQFSKYIEGFGGEWWHWIGNFWLVKFGDKRPAPTAAQISDQLISINNKARLIVSEVKDTDWAVADHQTAHDKTMIDWLERNWLTDD